MFEIDRIVRQALGEDIGLGDVTTRATVPEGTLSRAELVAKEDFVLAGIDVAGRVFALLDPAVDFEKLREDGQPIRRGEVLAWLRGEARSLLQGERVALNLLQRMSGIATHTARFVRELEGSGATVVDTRKTAPGLRVLEKYAVRMGGGQNHRFGLYDGVLIKDNHIKAAGSITEAVEKVRKRASHSHKIEVETKTLEEVREALAEKVDIIMLDNMQIDTMQEAVKVINGRALVEASGNVTLDTIRAIAETGVDFISSGSLTHSAPAADISMKIK